MYCFSISSVQHSNIAHSSATLSPFECSTAFAVVSFALCDSTATTEYTTALQLPVPILLFIKLELRSSKILMHSTRSQWQQKEQGPLDSLWLWETSPTSVSTVTGSNFSLGPVRLVPPDLPLHSTSAALLPPRSILPPVPSLPAQPLVPSFPILPSSTVFY
uniref:AlNc14C13G1598 protein n=1 Tax=Albugo laibachii Nc14 TaxID=890382 RepID=F0W3N8_9STRA|nr:AlNc14C13G1598 [Albugo laibachii Nc14]|eukprot:CCA15681.1 AlNc14C13G1598 [Albugo laibachii Nc14]